MNEATKLIEQMAPVFALATTGFEEFHNQAGAKSSGNYSQSASSGYYSQSASSGYYSQSASSGKLPESATGGEWIGLYRAITGACAEGCKQFVRGKSLELSAKYTAQQVAELVAGSYGADKFAAAMKGIK